MRVGSYEVLDEIGRGAVGAVFRARANDGRIVALKLIRSAQDPERVRREVRLLADLGESAGFVPLLDSGITPSGCFIVMPFLDGGTLRDRLRRGTLPLDEAVALGIRLGTALGVAHERGIVHRDLKPENVLFAASGEAFVADLGLAKHFRKDVLGASASLSLSSGGDLRGTIGYAPLEQLTDSKEVGPPADVFALGAILHECLCGTPAFHGDSPLEVIARVESGTRTSLVASGPKLPRAVVQVIERSLARSPEARYASCGDLARALEAATLRGGRSPAVAVAVALVLAVATSAVAGVALFYRQPEVPAPAPTAKAESPPSSPIPLPALCSGSCRAPTPS
jgi:serine/threonine-protein kinase